MVLGGKEDSEWLAVPYLYWWKGSDPSRPDEKEASCTSDGQGCPAGGPWLDGWTDKACRHQQHQVPAVTTLLLRHSIETILRKDLGPGPNQASKNTKVRKQPCTALQPSWSIPRLAKARRESLEQ
ncbi:hypothetical protein RvY_18213-2 [Ramazzottius varieornatus]|uniref:Uncharacterized protein n=1 Tax=Ramazzottius varieornatus TaxID=947166 RepID=A0A1D1WAU3_RAMVA|nr:hypothetical protein RvY_18213-2 [Ramazzottius varieornatus]